MNIVNLTPHTVVVAADFNSSRVEFPSEGVARVSSFNNSIGTVDGIEVVDCHYSEVEGLPEPVEGTIYLVSMVVGNRPEVQVRKDVLCPDTSPAASIRYPKGYILGGKLNEETGLIEGGKDMTGLIFGVTRFVKY